MSILVIAEHNGNEIAHATLTTVQAAQKIDSSDVHLFLAAAPDSAVFKAASHIEGLKNVIACKGTVFENMLAEPLADEIVKIAREYSHILVPASFFGKNVMPRIAALLDAQPISDITKVVDADTFERPIYAGNAFETVQSLESLKVLSVRMTAFDAVSASGNSAAIEEIAATSDDSRTQFVRRELTKSERPDLSIASVVISGGRALGSAENFEKYIEPLADKLGAAIGASRAAVDAGYVPNDYQVGQTGKIVAPGLYIAVGISGAVQHLAGMKDSKVIVAINKDEDAPIFQVADYGLVGDLFEILPELEKMLS